MCIFTFIYCDVVVIAIHSWFYKFSYPAEAAIVIQRMFRKKLLFWIIKTVSLLYNFHSNFQHNFHHYWSTYRRGACVVHYSPRIKIVEVSHSCVDSFSSSRLSKRMQARGPFQVQEEMKATRCQVRAVMGVVHLYPPKRSDLILSVRRRMWHTVLLK